MSEHPETTSPRRAWLRQAFEDVGEVEWYFTFTGYVIVSVLGAQFVGDGTVVGTDLLMGFPLALLAGWFARRDHGTTAFVLGAAAMVLAFVTGAGIVVLD